MTPETTLRLAVTYLQDIDKAIDAHADDDDPWLRSNVRQDMRHQLLRCRELIAQLELSAPDISALHEVDGEQVQIDLTGARQVCHCTEAKIMARCYDDYTSAAMHMEHAIAISPEYAGNHAQLAIFEMKNWQLAKAREAIERAIALDPENLQFYKVRDVIASQGQAPDPTPSYPWWHVMRWRP